MNNQKLDTQIDLQQAKSSAPQLKACTFSIGSETFSIPLEYVREITEVSEIFPLPLTPAYVDGIVHLRGYAIPVLSLGKIRNIIEEHKKIKQLIVLDTGVDRFAIAVNERPDLKTEFSGETINVQQLFQRYRVS